jgi:hypothetical protein
MHTALNVMTAIKNLVNDPAFKAKHRISESAFTRERHLSFVRVTGLILQKSLKSLQLMLNEFFGKLQQTLHLPLETVTASAWTQARQKLKYTAFCALTTQALVATYYQTPTYRTWRGWRVLAVDGSKIRLPDTPAMRREFGTMAFSNQHPGVQGEYPYGLSVVYYDVLNQIPFASTLAHSTAYEVEVAMALRPPLRPTDLVLCDRGFPSYRFFATLLAANTHVVGRCSRMSFAEARSLFADDAPVSRVVTLRPPPGQKASLLALGLPLDIRIRFVRVVLDSGEVEVLGTSLLDDATLPSEWFKELYGLRWGVETFYDRVKNRLNLEHFSGKTVEAVKQDFYATLFISGLESILIHDAQQHLGHKTPKNQYPQQVNKMVSFNTIKNHVIDLFLSDLDPSTLYAELTHLFLTNPGPIRHGRKVDRIKRNATQLVHYDKRIKKICF